MASILYEQKVNCKITAKFNSNPQDRLWNFYSRCNSTESITKIYASHIYRTSIKGEGFNVKFSDTVIVIFVQASCKQRKICLSR